MRLDDEPDALVLGQPLLFEKQKEVPLEVISSNTFQHNLAILKKSQFRLNGIGLAAPQIGWGVRVFCLGLDDTNDNSIDIPFQYWINPVIKAFSPTTCWTWEGCLSVPDLQGWVERPSHIEVEGYNEKGEISSVKINEFHARVFQHEFDHINGILFPMRVKDVSFIIPSKSLLNQQKWSKDWPTSNARKTPGGVLSPTK